MLAVNKLISCQTENNEKIVERILWLNNAQDVGFFIDIYSNCLPCARSIREIEEGIDNGSIVFEAEDPFGRIINEENIPEKHKVARDKAWEIIKDIVVLEPIIYIPAERRKLILKACDCHNVHESTVVRYLKKYWKRGKTKNALLPDYYMCGGRGKEKEAGEVKRGRPRKNALLLGNGINVDEDIKKIFKIAINKYYYKPAKKSLKLAYELMLKEYFSAESRIKDGIELSVIKSEVPTYGQFRYWFQKERDLKKEISTRKSAVKYEQSHRPIIGNSTVEALGPGSIYQIDATIGDVYLVSRFNRNWIIGRPVIYTVMDVFSRMIAGLYVGLEGPSWLGAMMALSNAAADKVAFCKEYGIEIEEEEWPVHYLPEAILADRGELEGSNIETLINTFHIKVQNTPPYRADWKGIIEQHFRVTNLRTKPFLPGAVNPGARERGGRDYRLDAKLDIYQFTQIIIKCALYHNNHHYLSNYNREEMMIEDDVEPIPVKLWNWGIANRSGKLRYVPEDIVKLNLMPTGTATVTARGIKFKGLLYGSKQSLKERWFEKARNRGAWKVEVSCDPRMMDYIYIKGEDGMSFEKCFLLEHQQRYKGKTLEEIDYLLEYERLQEKKYTEKKLQSKVDLIAEIENIVRQAEQDTEQERINTDSKRSRLKNIRQNRMVEKMLQREKEAFDLDKSKMVENSEVVSFKQPDDEEVDDGFNLLLRKQREALKKIHE